MPPSAAAGFRPAFVVPRYGPEVVGGAEDLARRTAEELARRGFEVGVLTTCALDHYTWVNHYPAGATMINGVSVTRFPAQTRLGNASVRRAARKVGEGQTLSRGEQKLWIGGVVTSEGLLDFLKENGGGFSHLLFLPYLFGTTYYGSRVHPERSYIIPCLHDEPYARQPLIKKMLLGVRGLIFNSPGERMLASRLLGVEDPGPVVGMGFRPARGDAHAFRNRYPVRGDFVLYAGRREKLKNTPMLVDYFRRFSARFPGRCSMVLLGTGDVDVPVDCSDIILDPGRVSEAVKWDGYAAASVFCQPSVNESLSIVLLESWLAGRPALVNRDCEVTYEHVRRSGGGVGFRDFLEFAEALMMLLDDREAAAAAGAAGRAYVEREYNWDSVIERLLRALGVKGD